MTGLKYWHLLFCFIGVILLCLVTPFPAAAEEELNLPPGFELVREAQGVAFFIKPYAKGSPDYVQIADLRKGAEVFVLHGSISNPASGQGVYGGDNARFNRLSIKQFWNQLTDLTGSPFCVTNGQFFRLADSPTPLPFPLKKDGRVLTDGYGIDEFPEQKLILELWPDRLDIRPLTQENLYTSTAPNIVAGLTDDAEKASKKAVGRTFIGIDDRDRDRVYDTLIIFNTRTARPSAAADVLREFGADKIMMLDGGGSTQLICQDEVYIDTERLVPQALGIAAGSLPPIAAALTSPVDVPILAAADGTILKIMVRNQGVQSWHPGNTKILVEAQNLFHSSLNIRDEVPTGSQVELELVIPKIENGGLYPVKVSIDFKGELFPVEAGTFEFVYLPPDIASNSDELQALLTEGSSQPNDALSARIVQWVEDNQAKEPGGIGGGELTAARIAPQAAAATPTFPQTSKDVLWIPILMIPTAFIMFAAIRRLQSAQE